MSRLSVYVDGFNLYHAIDHLKRPHLKWLDLWQLAELLKGDGEAVRSVHYFSAHATWLPDKFARHREFVAALKSVGVTIHLAKFKEKPRECKKCGARWIHHEEKETDVDIAVHLVADALRDQFDRAIIISADSDLAPAIKIVRALAPRKRLMVAAPPGRFGHARDLKPKLEITPGRLGRCLLPSQIALPTGALATRPASYDPPPA